jgi:hypothetical protein
MQAEGIISNPISKDIRLKGHQSIRFNPDGFSVLVSDASYRPVFLRQYVYDRSVPATTFPSECGRILKELQLQEFEGETVLIVDSEAVTVIPAQFFGEPEARPLLEKAASLEGSEHVAFRFIRDRNLYVVFAYAAGIDELKGQIKGNVQVIHAAECLVSLSDQVQASDHQRGFLLAEVQPYTLGLLVVQEDGIKLLNRFALKDPSDFIYHTLNTLKQLDLDRENTPVYLSGMVHPEHELFGLLGKYIRQVRTTPYYLEELTRIQMLRYMILSEGSKCAS